MKISILGGDIEEINVYKERRYVYLEKMYVILKRGEKIEREGGVYIIEKRVAIYNKVEGEEDVKRIENTEIWKEYKERE